MGHVVTVAGAKGGVGKTTSSINVGASLAANGFETVVVEMDLGMANVVDFLSLPESDAPTFHDVLAGEANPEAALQRLDDNLHVLPSGTDLDGYAATDLDRWSPVVEKLREAFDVVVVDTGAGLNRAVVEPLRVADKVVIVTTPRVASIRDAEKTKSLANKVDTEVCGFLLTKSGTGESPGPERIAEFMEVDLLGHVPDDEAVPASQDHGVPVVEYAPDSDAGETYRRVTERLLDALGMEPDDGFESGARVGADVAQGGEASAIANGGRAAEATDQGMPDPEQEVVVLREGESGDESKSESTLETTDPDAEQSSGDAEEVTGTDSNDRPAADPEPRSAPEPGNTSNEDEDAEPEVGDDSIANRVQSFIGKFTGG